MENKIILSVAVPCYKFSKYIEQCIKSIQSQVTNFDFEIVIADDHSEDGTKEILEKLASEDSRIIILESTQNLGVFHNVKRLYESCSGKYIASLDGDDYLTDTNKFQKQVDFLEKNPEFSLHSTGSFYVDELGNNLLEGAFLSPKKELVRIEDLLSTNIISFGRLFRNVPNLIEDWMSQTPFLDWCINFQVLKHGMAKCENFPSGAYRNHGKGSITSLTDEEIHKKNELTQELIMNSLNDFSSFSKSKRNTESIAIIDCFANNDNIIDKLKQQIRRLTHIGVDILLISNLPVSEEILKTVNYFIYDCRNQLFEGEYTNINTVQFIETTSNRDKNIFVTKVVKPGLQRHGLSVLANLHNAVNLAKSLGYKNFWRFEVDDLFGTKSLEFIKSSPELMEKEGKKAILYYNHYEWEPNNISFHFQFYNIDFFLEKIPQIKNEEDYRTYLMKNYGNLDFEIAEQFIYRNLKRNGDSEVLVRDGGKMFLDFPDTIWNTIQSTSNLESKYRNCPTTLFKNVSSDDLVLLSRNQTNLAVNRSIVVKTKSGEARYNHNMPCGGSWTYNLIGKISDVIQIDVYQDDKLIYIEENKNLENTIQFL